MGNPLGVKRDFDALEKRRLHAAALLEKGIHEAEVARRVGVHRQSVNRWRRTLEESDRTALRKAGRAGRKPLVSERDLRTIEADLKRGPETLGYETGLWTTQRVAELIEERFGVRYTPEHVGWLLRRLGWSCQRPVGRALERNEAAVRRWKKQRWPELKKKPTGRAAR
jgi:transposase